ncbi:hypothetical protein [Roseibium aggregatum]|uniref:hypothetical protein n=1 Tax=Roseibium aggregatum TaxID=187304 RepID=UPI001E5CD69E|nr:hypothetical protein [Roseibium aggregatum]UES46811.1 hypothetical protein GFK90_25240 [Roseibium aggregatum]
MILLALVFIVLVAASFSIGVAVRRTGGLNLGQLKSLSSVNPSVEAVFIALVLSYSTFTLLNVVVPTLSDPVFDATNTPRLDKQDIIVELQYRCINVQGPGGGVNKVCTSVPNTVERNVGIELEFPSSVPINEDFSIAARATSTLDFPDGVYTAELYKPKSIEARSSDTCDKDQEADGVVLTACRAITSSDLVDFRWTLTPTQTGRAEIAIKTNTLDFSGVTTASPGGAINLSYGGRSGAISADSPTLTFGELELDGPRSEIRFPIRVLTTVGVDQTTFDRLKIVGAVISALAALLGAGFLLKVTGNQAED